MIRQNSVKYSPESTPHAGETLLDYLESYGWTQKELAQRTDLTPKTVSEICSGKAPISPRTALALEKVFERPARFWLGLQRLYDEYDARRLEEASIGPWLEWAKRFPVSQMRNAGYFAHLDVTEGPVETLLRFFAVASPRSWQTVWEAANPAYRQTAKFKKSQEALSAWVRATEVFAEYLENQIPVSEFDSRKLRKLIPELRRQTVNKVTDALGVVQELCAGVGVLFVIVPELGKTGVSGCTNWISDTKVIVALTLRHKRDDIFWFTFFHELGHVLLHKGRFGLVLDNATESVSDKIIDIPMASVEEEANRFAADTLIEPMALEALIKVGIPDEDTLLEFAREQQVSPGIVVGRLQHLGILPRSVGNHFKQTISWSFSK